MRLWSLHPRYLDARGLVACWRETLLAKKVLLGETRGYRSHPQLWRFRAGDEPVALIDAYLAGLCEEAKSRNYRFDLTKIGQPSTQKLTVTEGQLAYEIGHLRAKLAHRDPARLAVSDPADAIVPHPLFLVVPGSIEDWERIG